MLRRHRSWADFVETISTTEGFWLNAKPLNEEARSTVQVGRTFTIISSMRHGINLIACLHVSQLNLRISDSFIIFLAGAFYFRPRSVRDDQ